MIIALNLKTLFGSKYHNIITMNLQFYQNIKWHLSLLLILLNFIDVTQLSGVVGKHMYKKIITMMKNLIHLINLIISHNI